MKQILLIFLGGGFGSILRYLVIRTSIDWTYPFLGTFAVNVLGSIIMGFLMGWGVRQEVLSSNTSLLLITGFCGGFTTFSAFSYENQVFLTTGNFLPFLGYTLSSILFGVLGVFLGLSISRLF